VAVVRLETKPALVVEFALLLPAENAVADTARIYQIVGKMQNELRDFDPKAVVQVREVRWSR
jgi:hypothetical protein